jgi:hypothetical protein
MIYVLCSLCSTCTKYKLKFSYECSITTAIRGRCRWTWRWMVCPAECPGIRLAIFSNAVRTLWWLPVRFTFRILPVWLERWVCRDVSSLSKKFFTLTALQGNVRTVNGASSSLTYGALNGILRKWQFLVLLRRLCATFAVAITTERHSYNHKYKFLRNSGWKVW